MLVVVHPAAADVERPQRPVERQPAEAEPALGVLERLRRRFTHASIASAANSVAIASCAPSSVVRILSSASYALST